ncbi:hypothetical protein HanPI659440_Chr09g0349941 [Helianthus annuus]|nr:hypothetical protein HanPI659440_Chr09g0349941 [Helianthus annuus]
MFRRRDGLSAQIRPNIDLFYICLLYAKRQLSNPSALYLLHSTVVCDRSFPSFCSCIISLSFLCKISTLSVSINYSLIDFVCTCLMTSFL